MTADLKSAAAMLVDEALRPHVGHVVEITDPDGETFVRLVCRTCGDQTLLELDE